MNKRRIIIATRESPLALRQAEWVRAKLMAMHPHLSVDFLGITTEADKMLNITLEKVGGKGLFVKELEDALYDGRADMAVHSMKDVPMTLPPGLALPVICEREDPRDVFVSTEYHSLMALPPNARIGTSSLRRQTQLKHLRRDLVIDHLRGNVNTRLRRLETKDFVGIVLAAAGLKRMQLANRIRYYFAPEEILPAAGQGALGIECREDDEGVLALIAGLDHAKTKACVMAERALCRRLEGGCTVPIGAYAQCHDDHLHLRGLIANAQGTRILRTEQRGTQAQAEQLGYQAAVSLIEQGGEAILREFRDH